MCDYSLKHAKSRPAVVGDKLVTKDFGTGSRGFAGVDDPSTAVCVLPGTELAFDQPIVAYQFAPSDNGPTTAIFRQVDLNEPLCHHDAIELPDGQQIKLTFLTAGQHATVLQLPAAPKTAEEAKGQERLEVVG
jgi:hypothetical protein